MKNKPANYYNKTYHNGITVTQEEENANWHKAKALLQREGVYETLANFGPFFPNKAKRLHKVIESFIREGLEFTIIESEAMYFSIESMQMSSPRREREVWYQPVKS